ncbi:hypothetical protein GCM10022397_27790 [Flavivirga jejuensis]
MLLGFTRKKTIHKIVCVSLFKRILNGAYKLVYVQITEKLIDNDREGIILECTEIPLGIKQSNVFSPVFNTITIQAPNAFETALKL